MTQKKTLTIKTSVSSAHARNPASGNTKRNTANATGEPAIRARRRRSGVIHGALVLMLCAVGIAAAHGVENIETLSSGCEVDYPPFCIVDQDERADGFSVELMRAALAAMGHKVTFRTGPWAEVRGWLERGEIDCLPLVGRTPEREPLFDFSIPYLTMHGCIVLRNDTTGISHLQDLQGKRVGVMQGDNAEEFLRREARGFAIAAVPTFADALQALADGQTDAVVMQRLVALRLLDETGLASQLKVVKQPITAFSQDFCFAVTEGDRDTLALLNEGLALVIADGTHRRLHAKWFATLQLPHDRPLVMGGDYDYPPFEFLDKDGQPAGYNVDLMRALADAIGIDIQIRLGPWTTIQDDLAQGELDGILGMFYSPERDERFDFSQTHIVNHCVSVVRRGSGPPPSNVDALAGLSLVVQSGDIMHSFARDHGLTNNLTPVATQKEALRAVAAGKHDCALVARMTALYWIENLKLEALVVGRSALLEPEYCIAVPNGNKALMAQLSEGLNLLEQSGKYREIHERWMGVYGNHFMLNDVLRMMAMIALPLLLVLGMVLLWSWSLRRQVAERTAALQRSEEKYRLAFMTSPDSININRLSDGLYLEVNKGFEHIMGYKREDVMGRTSTELNIWKDPDDRQRLLDGLRKDGYVENLSAQFCGAEGTVRDGLMSACLIELKGEQCILSITRDITMRKQAERRVQESEARLSLATKAAGIGIWDRDIELNRLTWDDRMFDIYGVTPDAFGGAYEAWQQGVHPEDLAQAVAEVDAAERGEKAFDTEFRIVRPDGQVRHIKAHAQVLTDAAGNPKRMIGTNQDITDRIAMEFQLAQTRKLEAVGRLAGGVAHDFNNLLMGMMNYIDLCRDELEDGHPAKEWLAEVMEEAQRSATLVRQLLAFARKQTIAPKIIDLNDAIGGMLPMLRRLIAEDIDLRWCPSDAVRCVKLDPAQIDQILVNLCVNARDAIAGVGTVTIETQNVSIDENYCDDHPEARVGDFVLLAVSDDGCGMDHETLVNVFEPFYTTKPEGEGTGLGLATIYGIVKQNEGFVNVYSEPGKGTTFRIYLPPSEPSGLQQAQRESNEKPQTGDETILLAEDEKAVRQTTQIFLRKLGFTVLSGASPEEALQVASDYTADHPDGIDLLITDVVMPGMNGRDLAATLSEKHPDLRVLYMSGYTANVIADRGMLKDGVAFLSKPFSRQELARKVREVLNTET